MKVNIDLQIALENQESDIPDIKEIELWAKTALEGAEYYHDSEITVRLVMPDEIQELNNEYRHKDKPTNILSFPFECPPEFPDLPLLGDLIICDEIVRQEAKDQGKTYKEHFAHLIVHGCLHLLGFDHIEVKDASIMEPLEVKILKQLGYPDPYGDLTNN